MDGLLPTMDKNMSRNDGQSSNALKNDRIFRRGSADLVKKVSFPDSSEERNLTAQP